MRLNRAVIIDGQTHDILISDETEALLEAKASGRAILGVCRQETGDSADVATGHFSCPAHYLVETMEAVDGELLERVVRRHLNLPWKIAETSRLLIREWTLEDVKKLPQEEERDIQEENFWQEDTMASYIKSQYGFYEYGIWALEDHGTGRIIGMAGISNLELPSGNTVPELGYHIFKPDRARGYAKEACEAILSYAAACLDMEQIYTKIDASNEASIHIARRLGFRFIQTYSEEMRHMNLYEWCSPESQHMGE